MLLPKILSLADFPLRSRSASSNGSGLRPTVVVVWLAGVGGGPAVVALCLLLFEALLAPVASRYSSLARSKSRRSSALSSILVGSLLSISRVFVCVKCEWGCGSSERVSE